jgi:putative tryptophan/tyrosine transport system substrate-binding protein
MRRRFALVFWLVAILFETGHAPAADRTYRLGVLATNPIAIDTLRLVTLTELAKHGFVEGRNLVIDIRFAHANFLRGTGIAQQLLDAKPDVVIGIGPLAIAALKDATTTVPIVMSLGPDDPKAYGFADSLARPTENITGLIAMSTELDSKRLQLLREAAPSVRRIATFLVPDVQVNMPALQKSAADVGLEFVGARTAFNRHEYPAALEALRGAGAEAIMINSAPLFSDDPIDLVRLATEARLATVCEWRGLVERGCLIGYGPDLVELRRRTADYVARLFEGASPAALPIEGPTHFELTINLKTTRALGIDIPPSLLIRADEVIE